MPEVRLSYGGKSLNLLSGDLLQFLRQGTAPLGIALNSAAIAELAMGPMSKLPEGGAGTAFQFDRDAEWDLGGAGSVTLGVSGGSSGSMRLFRSGEVFQYAEDDGEGKPRVVEVPAGFAYASVEFEVSIEVNGGAAFSSGAFGVSGSASAGAMFRVANYRCFAESTTVADAVEQLFQGFALPFHAGSVSGLGAGDYLEYEFVGKLALGIGVSYGFGGVQLAGRSRAEVIQAAGTELGKVVISAAPSVAAAAALSVGYDYEDAFRIVTGKPHESGGSVAALYVFRMDQRRLSVKVSAAVTLSAGAEVGVQLDVDKVVDAAAERLFGNLEEPDRTTAMDAFRKRIVSPGSRRELQRYMQEAGEQVNKLLKKTDRKLGLQVLHERISTHSSLLSYGFDLSEPRALSEGYALAVSGDMRGALRAPGVSILAGSYVQDEVIRRTTMQFQFFDLLRVRSMTEYFDRTAVVYAGNGVFKLRDVKGVRHEHGQVGHEAAVEVYFTAEATRLRAGSLENVDVRMQFSMVDRDGDSALQSARMLEILGSDSELLSAAARLRTLSAADPNLQVKVAAVIHASAYEKLAYAEFVRGSAPALDHQEPDRRNWRQFVGAVDAILRDGGFETEGFPDRVDDYDEWSEYNQMARGVGPSKPPDRKNCGNLNTDSVWPVRWRNVPGPKRNLMVVYMEAGRMFMNLCEDLKVLATRLELTQTEQTYGDLLRLLDGMVKRDVHVWFTKPALAALCQLTGSGVKVVSAPESDEDTVPRFSLSLEVR